MRRIKSIHITAHPSFYKAMEDLNNRFIKQNGISLSQPELTNIMAKKIKINRIPDLIDNKKRRAK